MNPDRVVERSSQRPFILPRRNFSLQLGNGKGENFLSAVGKLFFSGFISLAFSLAGISFKQITLLNPPKRPHPPQLSRYFYCLDAQDSTMSTMRCRADVLFFLAAVLPRGGAILQWNLTCYSSNQLHITAKGLMTPCCHLPFFGFLDPSSKYEGVALRRMCVCVC